MWKRASSRFLRNCTSPVRVPIARARSIISRASGAHCAVSPAISCAMKRLSALVISTPSRPSWRAAAIDLASHCSQFSPFVTSVAEPSAPYASAAGSPSRSASATAARASTIAPSGSHFTRGEIPRAQHAHRDLGRRVLGGQELHRALEARPDELELNGPPRAPGDVLLSAQHSDPIDGCRVLRERETVLDATRERERFGGIEEEVRFRLRIGRRRGDREVVGALVAR